MLLAGVFLCSQPARAQQCLPMLDKLAKPIVQQALRAGQSRVCRKVPRYSATRAIKLLAIEVCMGAGSITIDGTVEITCGTPAGAILSGQVSETVDFAGDFDLRACALRNVRAEPRSALGKTMAAGLGLQQKLESRLNRQLALFCR